MKTQTIYFIPVGLCTTTKKWRGTEETRKTSEHYLPCPTLICSTKSDFSDMGTWNWKSEYKNLNATLLAFFPFFFPNLSQTLCLRTVTVSSLLRLCNHIVFQTYSMSVYLVRQLTSPLLLQRLRMKGIRNPDHSRALSNLNYENTPLFPTRSEVKLQQFYLD